MRSEMGSPRSLWIREQTGSRPIRTLQTTRKADSLRAPSAIPPACVYRCSNVDAQIRLPLVACHGADGAGFLLILPVCLPRASFGALRSRKPAVSPKFQAAFLNNRKKLAVVAEATASTETPFRRAISSATKRTYAGWLVLPRYGTGAR